MFTSSISALPFESLDILLWTVSMRFLCRWILDSILWPISYWLRLDKFCALLCLKPDQSVCKWNDDRETKWTRSLVSSRDHHHQNQECRVSEAHLKIGTRIDCVYNTQYWMFNHFRDPIVQLQEFLSHLPCLQPKHWSRPRASNDLILSLLVIRLAALDPQK